jgi:type II secretory pathway pseudopilin PulG
MRAIHPSASSVSGGYTSVELVIVAGLIATMSALTLPGMLSSIDDSRARGAARYIAGRLQRARMEAVTRSSNVALQFVQSADGYTFAMYVDGNANGVRTVDIQRGIDRQLLVPERLSEGFQGIEFGAVPGLPPVDPGSPPPGTDPIKLGASNLASFSAMGTSSSGTLYIRGQHTAQYAVRIFGDSGKTRVLKFDAGTQRWNPL